MIRIIVRVDDASMAANVGGSVSVETKHKTFDLDIPEVEKYLRDAYGAYSHANVVGVELLEPNASIQRQEIYGQYRV